MIYHIHVYLSIEDKFSQRYFNLPQITPITNENDQIMQKFKKKEYLTCLATILLHLLDYKLH